MSERVNQALRERVSARARYCCEYCGLPDDAVLVRHVPDHIIASKHDGPTSLENLAYACYSCNHAKGSDIASVDPLDGAIARLFHPRADRWDDHFRWDGAVIAPLTPIGRATVSLLRLNAPQRTATRANLLAQGRYPFATRPF